MARTVALLRASFIAPRAMLATHGPRFVPILVGWFGRRARAHGADREPRDSDLVEAGLTYLVIIISAAPDLDRLGIALDA